MNRLTNKRKRFKLRCMNDKCNTIVQFAMKELGKCKYCNNIYCSEHRLPEDHKCINLDKCKEASFNINAGKNSDIIDVQKVIKI